MNDKAWEKRATLGGVIFVILNVVGVILQGSPPKSDDSDQKVLDWLVDKEGGIRLGSLLGALSIVALFLWFGSLWRRMSKVEGGNHRLSVISLGGLVGSGVLFAASSSILSLLAIRVDTLDPTGAKFFYLLSTIFLSMAGAFLFVHLFATSLLAYHSKFLPSWNAILGFIPAFAFLISTVGVYDDTNLAMITGLIGFGTWCIWLLATSFHLFKTSDTY